MDERYRTQTNIQSRMVWHFVIKLMMFVSIKKWRIKKHTISHNGREYEEDKLERINMEMSFSFFQFDEEDILF